MEMIEINTEFIKLDQLLKWLNLVSGGGEAKEVIISGLVSVNGFVETRRGKKIYPGDQITFFENTYQVVATKDEKA